MKHEIYTHLEMLKDKENSIVLFAKFTSLLKGPKL